MEKFILDLHLFTFCSVVLMVQNQICGLPRAAWLTMVAEGSPCPCGCPQKQERRVCVPERRLTPAQAHVQPCAHGHSGEQGWLGRAELPHHGTALRHSATARRYGTAQRQQATPPRTTSPSRPAPHRRAAGSRAAVWMFAGSQLQRPAPKTGGEPPTPSPSPRALA